MTEKLKPEPIPSDLRYDVDSNPAVDGTMIEQRREQIRDLNKGAAKEESHK